MITKNFKTRIATLLQMSTSSSTSTYKGLLSVKDIGGTTRYICCYYSGSFPNSVSYPVTFNPNAAGIQVGTGSTAATEDDYKLESPITSGMSASIPTITIDLDSSGNPYIEYLFTLTNNTSSDIVVREIGYVQTLRAPDTQGGSSGYDRYFLFDRTVLDTPVTVPANDSAAIKYRLKTVLASS
jgi:hypothetical protein